MLSKTVHRLRIIVFAFRLKLENFEVKSKEYIQFCGRSRRS